MVWNWSHTDEAYANVRKNIANQSRDWLEDVYAEWHAPLKRKKDIFSEKKYALARLRAKKLDSTTLAEFIYDRASEQALCTNGGWEAWCCPYGCSCHMQPFSLEENEE